ncbi:MAG TPA: septum formation initiator family protein [Pyrinomonadaceae bacterium]|nr:septum formation initiator family protein [Pyrinomonadaceae bacterium]
MNKAANTYWVDNRLRAQRVATRAIPSLASPARDLSREIIGTRTEIRRRGGLIPSWVVFVTIILATFAICVTVTMRTHAELRTASQHYEKVNSEVETLRNNNASLASEVQRLHSDRHFIESAARQRLRMVRANEIIVPIE